MSYTAGEGRLAIVPDATGFADKLKADMSKIRAEFALRLTADTGQARADIERFRDLQQRNGIRVPVDLDIKTREASEKTSEWRRKESSRPVDTQLDIDLREAESRLRELRIREESRKLGVTVAVDADPKRADQQLRLLRTQAEARRIELRVDADTNNAERKIDELRRKSFGNSGDLKTAGLFTLGSAIVSPASIALVTDLAGALQQLAQSALVVPGALAGVGASVGTMVLGLSGIKDAYSAVTKASASSSQDQAQQAQAEARAHDQLRNSVVDDANAHKDLANAYRDARQELQDLNIEARGGQISEAQAINDALKARRDLMKGGFKDTLDYNDALLRVQSADQRVVEVHQRNIETQDKLQDANAKGIANNDKVVAAQERVIRSGQQVAEAQTTVDMATSKASASATAAAQAMGKLGPNAQALVTTLTTLTPTFQAFRTAISQPLLDGVSGGIQRLVAADLPLLQNGMSRIAKAINDNFRALGTSLGSSDTRGLLDRILGNTADAQARVSKFIDPLVHGLGTLAAAGSDSLPRLVDDLGHMAERFSAFIDAADKDGRLDKWINDGITGMEHLGSTLLNLGKSFTAITQAAGGGAGLLATLDAATQKLAAFLNSDRGQQELRDFFRQAHEDLAKWLPILEQLPALLHGVLDAAHDWMSVWMPPLQTAAKLLGDYPGLTEAVVVGFGAWKTISGVTSLLEGLTKINNLLGVALPASSEKTATALSANLGGVFKILGPIAAALAFFETGKNLYDSGTKGDAEFPGQTTPSDPKGYKGEQDKHTGSIVMGIPGATFKPVPDTSKTPSPAASNDLPFAGGPAGPKFEAPPGYVPTPGSPAEQLPGGVPAQTPVWQGGPVPGSPKNPLLVPFAGYAMGGPTPSGRGNGPTGGWISELHGDEWVLPAHARKTVGDAALAALTNGRSFDVGGTVDQYGNPVTPGMVPGPSQPNIAPNPTAGGPGIVNSIIGGVTSGIGGPIGNALGLVSAIPGISGVPGATQAGPGGGLASSFAQMPGIAGLFGSLASPNPLQASLNWGSQTANYVANWGVKTAGSFLSTLWQGGLDFFGLGNSILSPNNSWNQALQKTGQFALGQQGPLGALLGGAGGLGGDLQIGQEGIPLGDGSVIGVPTFGTSGTPNSIMPSTAASAAPAAASGSVKGGAESWRPLVRATLQKYGPQFGITNYQLWEDRIIRQIATESGGNPTAINNTDSNAQAGHPSQGLLQFIPSTFASNNISGGSYLDPASQIAAVIPYVVHRYGMDSAGGPNAIGQGHGYAAGGPTPYGSGPLPDGGYPAVVHPGEFMISARGRATVSDSFLHQLNAGQLRGFVDGGPIPQAYIAPNPNNAVPAPPQPKPDFNSGPGAQFKQAPAAAVPTPAAPHPSAVTPPPPQMGAAATAAPSAAPPYVPAPNIGAAPSNLNHNLPAISQGIASTASVLGNLASQAIGAGMAGAGLPGGGAAGQFAAGLIKEGGKIVDDAVNVGSSFLVGSVPGSFGSQDRAFGQTVTAPQNVPVTAPLRGGNSYQFTGISDVDRIMQVMDLKDAQSRAILAAHGG